MLIRTSLTLAVHGKTDITRALTVSFAMAALIVGCLPQSTRPSHHHQLARGVQSRTPPWRSGWADTTCICSTMPLLLAREGRMRSPNIETGRVILGLTNTLTNPAL